MLSFTYPFLLVAATLRVSPHFLYRDHQFLWHQICALLENKEGWARLPFLVKARPVPHSSSVDNHRFIPKLLECSCQHCRYVRYAYFQYNYKKVCNFLNKTYLFCGRQKNFFLKRNLQLHHFLLFFHSIHIGNEEYIILLFTFPLIT